MKPKKIVDEITKVWRYTVKFLSGHSDGSLLAKGDYFTAITLHNPHSEKIRFRWKVAVSESGIKPGFVPEFKFDSLGPDAILEITCAEMCNEVDLPQNDVYKGVIILESTAELNIAAIYTAAGAGGHVVEFKYEDVMPRVMKLRELMRLPLRGLPDLVPLPAFAPPLRRDRHKLPQHYCFSSAGDTKADTVRIIVRNQGKGDAPESITTVQFQGRKPIHIETPAIAAGEETTVEATIPYECLANNSECMFEITVNATGAFDEASKENNKANGSCSW